MSIRGTRHLKIGGYSVEVIRKAIKNIHLSVHPPEGRLRVAVPSTTRDTAVRLLIIRKLPWIKKQIRSFENQERQNPPKFVSGESVLFRGVRYRLNVVHHKLPSTVAIQGKSRINLFLKKGASKSHKQLLFTEWVRQDLRNRIEPLLSKWEEQLGVQVKAWSIRQMKTKWGSCNPKTKRVLFNLELAKKDDRCLEYVIVHELVHLLERKHNDRFIAHLDRVMPKWRSYRAELNRSLGAYEVY
ncbi:M48 family metallopeptidase [bacterium]|nr:M48 family metallopeptidase [bacterium]